MESAGDKAPSRTRTSFDEPSLHSDLAEQILDEVIQDGMQKGTHLTELALAKKLKISRSPIRSALRHLEARGIVEAKANRGFFLKLGASELERSNNARPKSTIDEIYEQILRDYVTGVLPDTVNEKGLGERYTVKPATLRSVLLRLSEHGIMHRSRGKGWHFEPGLTTVDAQQQSYRFRILVECGGLLEPTFQVDRLSFDRVRNAQTDFLQNINRSSAAEFFAINSDFHQMLADCSNNLFIKRAVEHQNHLRRLNELALFSSLTFERMRESCDEHLQILDAVENADNERAAGLMGSHLSKLLASDVYNL